MLNNKKIVCVIPARLNSTRLPRKMLAKILDKTVLEWVWTATQKVPFFDHVTFATDSDQIADVITKFGGNYLMTSPECPSGTDRLIELVNSQKLSADIWVNWQGDEPFVCPSMISDLLQTCHSSTESVWTLKKKIEKEEEITSPSIVKVVCNSNDNALYFSRSTIPCYADLNVEKTYYKHIGLYAFTTKALKKIGTLEQSSLEVAEKLEHLRYLQSGLSIKVHETQNEIMEINTPEDLLNAQNYAQKHLAQQP